MLDVASDVNRSAAYAEEVEALVRAGVRRVMVLGAGAGMGIVRANAFPTVTLDRHTCLSLHNTTYAYPSGAADAGLLLSATWEIELGNHRGGGEDREEASR
jgi:hypothetical protein